MEFLARYCLILPNSGRPARQTIHRPLVETGLSQAPRAGRQPLPKRPRVQIVTALALVLVAVFGLVIGSFLNVVTWRVPRGESIVKPGSHCPGCGHELGWRDNIPVLSWVLLGGRCRYCGARISARYPATEMLTALVFVVLALITGVDWSLPAYLWLGGAGVALAIIDIEHKRLPNAITLPSYLVVGALLLLPAIIGGQWGDYLRAWLAGVILGGAYFGLALIYPKGMGMGDVKLAGVLGLALGWLGWSELIVGGFLAFVLGSVGGVIVMVATGSGRKAKIPFGPYMLAGALLGLWVGQPVAHWYQSLLVG